MQSWIGYLTAVVIAGFVLLLLFTVQEEGQRASLDALQYRQAKKGTLELTRMLELDFKNIGAGTRAPNASIVTFDTLASPRVFAFWAQEDSTHILDPVNWDSNLVRYEWQTLEYVELERGTVPVYDVTRLVDGAVTGSSTDIVTKLEIHLLDADSTTAATLADTRQIVVSVRGVSPLGVGDYLEETLWNTVFRPVNLSRLD